MQLKPMNVEQFSGRATTEKREDVAADDVCDHLTSYIPQEMRFKILDRIRGYAISIMYLQL